MFVCLWVYIYCSIEYPKGNKDLFSFVDTVLLGLNCKSGVNSISLQNFVKTLDGFMH